jgi:hypothetical protein
VHAACDEGAAGTASRLMVQLESLIAYPSGPPTGEERRRPESLTPISKGAFKPGVSNGQSPSTRLTAKHGRRPDYSRCPCQAPSAVSRHRQLLRPELTFSPLPQVL